MASFRRRVVGLVLVTTLCFTFGPALPSGASPPPPPGLPHAELTAAVSRLGTGLGVPLDPEPALAAARLDGALAGRLAATLRTLSDCGEASAALVAGLPAPPWALFGDGTPLAGPPEGSDAIRDCAVRLEHKGRELLQLAASARPAQGSDVELWPVLRLDLDGSDDTVAHDYILTVDTGGNDVYLNNAGGNLIDVRRGPPGSGAMSPAPARGCVNPAYDLLAGECVISEALLVDAAGDDTYGHMQPPDPGLDGLCTADPLVHRVMTGGVGSWGVGILLDGAGNDTYLGKSITLGAGHFGGVGMLIDEAGDDSYRAIRLAKGFGTLFGLGVFHDRGGNDAYSYYLPRPLDPAAPDRTLGAGGALDTGGTCDGVSRFDEGTGVFGGAGVFLEDGGDDVYQVAPPRAHEPGATGFIRLTGSLGFGDGGFGLFVDRSGTDRYQGMPGRADGASVGPSNSSSGFFHDHSASARRAAAGPGGSAALTAWFTHYIPETVTIDQGGSLQFFNPDLFGGPLGGRAHTITEHRPDGPPRFDVFVPWGQASPVGGVEALPPGTYHFHCRIHPFMRGNLMVR